MRSQLDDINRLINQHKQKIMKYALAHTITHDFITNKIHAGRLRVTERELTSLQTLGLLKRENFYDRAEWKPTKLARRLWRLPASGPERGA